MGITNSEIPLLEICASGTATWAISVTRMRHTSRSAGNTAISGGRWYKGTPWQPVTDELQNYVAARRELGPIGYSSNRAVQEQ